MDLRVISVTMMCDLSFGKDLYVIYGTKYCFLMLRVLFRATRNVVTHKFTFHHFNT